MILLVCHGILYLSMLVTKGFTSYLFQHANSLSGFDETAATKYEEKNFSVGFGREAILEHADKVIQSYR